MAAPVRLTPQGGLASPAATHACSPCLRFHSGYNPADENLPAISMPVRAGRWLRQSGGGDLGRAPAAGSVRHLQHRVGQRDRTDAALPGHWLPYGWNLGRSTARRPNSLLSPVAGLGGVHGRSGRDPDPPPVATCGSGAGSPQHRPGGRLLCGCPGVASRPGDPARLCGAIRRSTGAGPITRYSNGGQRDGAGVRSFHAGKFSGDLSAHLFPHTAGWCPYHLLGAGRPVAGGRNRRSDQGRQPRARPGVPPSLTAFHRLCRRHGITRSPSNS